MNLDPKTSLLTAGTALLLLLPFAACGGGGGRDPVTLTGNSGAPSGTIFTPASHVTIAPGQAVTFFANATDPGGNPVTVLWDFGDGTPKSTQLMAGEHVFTTAGTFTVTLTVTNSLGLSDPTPEVRTVIVQTEQINGAPSGSITTPPGNVTITAGQAVDFAGSVSDPDGQPVTVAWDFGDGTAPSTLLVPGGHTYAVAGVYTATMIATDSLGLSALTPATRTISVLVAAGNNPPNGTIDTPAGNIAITAGQPVAFTSTTSDPDGNPTTVVWNYGDGTATSNNPDPGNHVFNNAGTFTVTLTTTDSLGLADPTPATRTITVNPVAVFATLTQVQTAVFNSCTSCHGSGGDAGLDLRSGSSFANLVNVNATTLPGKRVVAGNPASSALVTMLASGHRSVSAVNRDLIASWINGGALNN